MKYEIFTTTASMDMRVSKSILFSFFVTNFRRVRLYSLMLPFFISDSIFFSRSPTLPSTPTVRFKLLKDELFEILQLKAMALVMSKDEVCLLRTEAESQTKSQLSGEYISFATVARRGWNESLLL